MGGRLSAAWGRLTSPCLQQGRRLHSAHHERRICHVTGEEIRLPWRSERRYALVAQTRRTSNPVGRNRTGNGAASPKPPPSLPSTVGREKNGSSRASNWLSRRCSADGEAGRGGARSTSFQIWATMQCNAAVTSLAADTDPIRCLHKALGANSVLSRYLHLCTVPWLSFDGITPCVLDARKCGHCPSRRRVRQREASQGKRETETASRAGSGAEWRRGRSR